MASTRTHSGHEYGNVPQENVSLTIAIEDSETQQVFDYDCLVQYYDNISHSTVNWEWNVPILDILRANISFDPNVPISTGFDAQISSCILRYLRDANLPIFTQTVTEPAIWGLIFEYLSYSESTRYLFVLSIIKHESDKTYMIPTLLGYAQVLSVVASICVKLLYDLSLINFKASLYIGVPIVTILFISTLVHIILIKQTLRKNVNQHQIRKLWDIKRELFGQYYQYVGTLGEPVKVFRNTCDKLLLLRYFYTSNECDSYLIAGGMEEHTKVASTVWELFIPVQKMSNVFQVCVINERIITQKKNVISLSPVIDSMPFLMKYYFLLLTTVFLVLLLLLGHNTTAWTVISLICIGLHSFEFMVYLLDLTTIGQDTGKIFFANVAVVLIMGFFCVAVFEEASFSVQRQSIIIGDLLLILFLGACHIKFQIGNQRRLFLKDDTKIDTEIESGPNKKKYHQQRTNYRPIYFYYHHHCCCWLGYPLTLAFFHSNSMKNLAFHYVKALNSEKTYTQPNGHSYGGW